MELGTLHQIIHLKLGYLKSNAFCLADKPPLLAINSISSHQSDATDAILTKSVVSTIIRHLVTLR